MIMFKKLKTGSRYYSRARLCVAILLMMAAGYFCLGLSKGFEGGGISTELYRYSPFGFEAQYPTDWVVEGVSGIAKWKKNSATRPSSCDDLKSKLKQNVVCEEAIFHNLASPISSVNVMFISAPQLENAERLLDVAKVWSPEVTNWVPQERTAYSVGYKFEREGTSGEFFFKDVYFPNKGLGVFITGIGNDSSSGIFGVQFIRDSISRIGEDLVLKSFRPEKEGYSAGDFVCYFFNVYSRRKLSNPPSLMVFEMQRDPTPVKRKVRISKSIEGFEETEIYACLSTSPRTVSNDGKIVRLEFQSESGSEVKCKVNSPSANLKSRAQSSGDSLLCASSYSLLNSNDAESRAYVVSGNFAEVSNSFPVNSGPIIQSLTLDTEKKEIVLKASATLGLASAYLYVSQLDGVFYSARDWLGSGIYTGLGSWLTPGNREAKIQGELHVPISVFVTKGPNVLRAVRVEDTAGNLTDLYLPQNKKSPIYDIKGDGIEKSEFGPALEWLNLGVNQ